MKKTLVAITAAILALTFGFMACGGKRGYGEILKHVTPTKLDIEPAAPQTVYVGRTMTFRATVLPDLADTDKSVTWTSSPSGIVTLSPSGPDGHTCTVTGAMDGTATVTAKTVAADLSQSCQVTAIVLTFSSVAARSGHSVALGADGTVWAWGMNGYGQLGDGTTTDRNAPVRVAGGM